MLACVHGNLNHLNMRIGIGDDGNSFDLRVCAQFLRIAVNSGDTQFFRNFFCACKVAVTDCDQLRARYAVCDVAGMLITQTSNTNNTNFQLFHTNSLLYVCKML